MALSQILEKYFIVHIVQIYGLKDKRFIKTMRNIDKAYDTGRMGNDQIGILNGTYEQARLIVDMNEIEMYRY